MSEPAPDAVLTRLHEGVLTVTFNRPQKKNAFTHAMYTAATQALVDGDRDPAVRVIALTGAGSSFTAGNDLLDFLAHPPEGEAAPVFQFLRALIHLEKPCVAAVDGAAVGIGTTLLQHCDFVLASDRARFSLPFINLGLSPEGGSSLLLPRLAGFALASELLMFGEPFDAPTAMRAGLVNRIVPADQLEAVLAERCAALAAKPAESLKVTKRLLREPLRAEVEAALAREATQFLQRLASAEAKEAFSAFLEKRKPDFSKA